jgi:hypothetical protein
MSYLFLALAILAGMIGLPLVAGAHGTGLFFEAAVGNFEMDIDFDTQEPMADQEVFIGFSLFTPPDSPDWEFASYTDLQLIFIRNGVTVYDKQLPPSDFRGRRFLNYTFPQDGDYTMTVRFLENEELLAEKSFPVTVKADPDAISTLNYIVAGIGIAVFIGGSVVYGCRFIARRSS